MSCSENQEFCLKYNSHEKQLSKAFTNLLEQEHLVDITLACDGNSIKAHRTVLSAFSAYFQNILVNINHSHPIIYLKDVKFPVLEALVQFMYRGEVSVKQQLLSQLLNLADSLQVKGLARSAEQNSPIISSDRETETREDNLSSEESLPQQQQQQSLTVQPAPVAKRRKISQPATNTTQKIDAAVKTECIDVEDDEGPVLSQGEEIESAEESSYTAHQLLEEITQHSLAMRGETLTAPEHYNVGISSSSNSSGVQSPASSAGGMMFVTLPGARFRSRFSWTEQQVRQLEAWYARQAYPSADTMHAYARTLAQMFPQMQGPTNKSVNYWFQNKRRLSKVASATKLQEVSSAAAKQQDA